MRFFDLLNLQDIILYFFPAVLAILIVGIALGYVHFRTSRSEERMKRSYYTFPEDIEDRQAPFPLSLILIIAGTVVWAFFYILVIGLWGVKSIIRSGKTRNPKRVILCHLGGDLSSLSHYPCERVFCFLCCGGPGSADLGLPAGQGCAR